MYRSICGPAPLVLARLGALVTIALLLTVLLPGRSFAAGGLVQDRLSPPLMTEGVATAARLTVHAPTCTTVKSLGVAVRDEDGENLDFPGAASDVQVCRRGRTIVTQEHTLPAGRYTVFGYWQDYAGGWHNLPAHTLTVLGSGATSGLGIPHFPGSTPSSPTAGKSLVWSEEFDGPVRWGSRWVGDTTSAFRYGDHNPDDHKLDWLSTDAVSVENGVATFTASPSGRTLENGRQAWDTGLLTTERSAEGFRARTGDYIETRVELPAGTGAWPALWTWKNGRNEVDTFEYHPDHPALLELTNHVRRRSGSYDDADEVGPGAWVTIGTYYGSRSVDWYVNGVRVHRDRAGVGTLWSAYLILNLSVSDGRYHPTPVDDTPLSFAADYVRVYR
ncbi:glycoside hydrolase family 16 protein [Kitasatospora sp. NPDC004240]